MIDVCASVQPTYHVADRSVASICICDKHATYGLSQGLISKTTQVIHRGHRGPYLFPTDCKLAFRRCLGCSHEPDDGEWPLSRAQFMRIEHGGCEE